MTAPKAMALVAPAMSMAPAVPEQPPVTTRILYGDLRTGLITGVLPVTGASWSRVENDAGTIDQVTVHRTVVRELGLRTNAAAARCFLAVEVDGRIRVAGPIWKHSWSKKQGRLVLGASGLRSLFDHRKVIQVLAAGQTVATGGDLGTVTLTGADYGEIARALVALAMSHVGGDLPLVLPDPRPGDAHTETFPGWSLLTLSDQLAQLVQRQDGGPDIRFTARRRSDDPRFIEWVMEVGTAAAPKLVQAGADWVFDTTPREGPVLDVAVEQDATAMAFRCWETGNGSEADTLMSVYEDDTLIDVGYPLLEDVDAHSTVEEQPTLDGYAQTYVAAHARPVEVWKLTVRGEAALEVLEGDYARVITRGDDYLPDGEHRVRIQKITGDLTTSAVLDMYPLQAVI